MYDQDPYTAQAYFYISFGDQEKQSPVNMIRSLIAQLCCQRPDTPKHIRDLFDRFRNMQPDLDRLEAALKATTDGFDRIYLTIDGLDECPRKGDERSQLLELIKRIQNWGLPNLHILVTSRNEQDIEESLKPLFTCPAATRIDLETHQQEVDTDIGIFIDERLKSPDFNSWPRKTKRSVKEALTEKADGM